jgi:two-component system, sensor histidine kinase and response regulator
MERLDILVVDDEPGMRLGVARALRDHVVYVKDLDCDVGFNVDQAETGEEALEKINANPPDILLLDYKLPGMNGLDILEQTSDLQGEKMLTVMITAYASLETAITATKRGAYDFLAKPFTPQELKNCIQKTAGRLIVTRQARKLAEERRRVRFQFISVVAHELKAPLAAIEGYLQIMKDQTVGEKIEAYEPMVQRSLVRLEGMRKLILDLLDMTRIESGAKKREFEDVDLIELVRRSIETVTPSAQQKDVTIRLEGVEALPMRGDRGELEIILNNLLSNAVKYNRDSGRVDVSVEAVDGKAQLKVGDTGIGMTQEEADKLFGEFVRIKNQKTRNIMGSGLGLSIVKKLTQMYNGSIDVESAPDEGTTFTVRLDRETAPEDAQEESTPQEQEA